MSWTLSVPNASKDGLADRLDEARALYVQSFVTTTQQPSPEAMEQIEVALAAAKELVESGAFGDASKTFNLTFCGHANANHEPAPGWANDCVTISVSQANLEV